MGAGKRIINGLRHVLPDVCPDGLQAVAHRAVQLVTQHRQIGVVEEERFFIMAPRDPQRLGRVEDHRQQGAQFGRRTRGGGGTGPIAVLQQPVGQLVGCGSIAECMSARPAQARAASAHHMLIHPAAWGAANRPPVHG
ncbi:hypothetical protein G6F68_015325 [Rhizopus microsporus]|nr:hypothetical protein G6F68_015325 [Rhizopus microsporus]